MVDAGREAHELGGFIELSESRLPSGVAGVVPLLVQIVFDRHPPIMG